MGGLGEDETIRGTADAARKPTYRFGGFDENGKYLGGISGPAAEHINQGIDMQILFSIHI
jgi:hypothetical protein